VGLCSSVACQAWFLVGRTCGGWTSIIQPPFEAYVTLGVREVSRDLLLVHHHRGRERGAGEEGDLLFESIRTKLAMGI
jgi:hypothetical protein